MNYRDLKPWQKPKALEKCVLSLTPAEAAKAFKEMGKVMFTARALGLACRYRGLEMVKALAEGGAGFRFDDGQVRKSRSRQRRRFIIRQTFYNRKLFSDTDRRSEPFTYERGLRRGKQ